MRGVIIDVVPEWGKLRLLLDGGREAHIPVTYPFYATEVDPSAYSHPDVVSIERETWKTFEGNLSLFKIESFNHKLRVRNRVNSFPPSWMQAYVRKGISPFRKVEIGKKDVNDLEDGFYEVKTLEVRKTPFSKPRILFNGDEIDYVPSDTVDVALSPPSVRVSSHVLLNSNKVKVNVGLRGFMEWSLISKMPLPVVASSTIGKILTTNEAWVALGRKFVVPNVRPNVERERTIEELVDTDKGGLILFPKPGIYDDAVQIDFNSMYPSLIIKYNISAETVNVECKDIITEIGHTICKEKLGIVPESLSYLVRRKEEMRNVDRERMEAIKWVLVASFGYLGYRNSRFGKIEAYELVTFFARKTMRRAIEISRSLGMEVLHGLIDSIIVRGKKDKISTLIEEIEKDTGIKLKIDADFLWVCFTSSSKGESYPQRYFGKTSSGMKVKGVIRRNQPKLIQDFLKEVLLIASTEDTAEDVKRKVNDALPELTEKYLFKSHFGDPMDYVISIRGRYYIKGDRLYQAREYLGHDPLYYEEYVKRTSMEVKRWFS